MSRLPRVLSSFTECAPAAAVALRFLAAALCLFAAGSTLRAAPDGPVLDLSAIPLPAPSSADLATAGGGTGHSDYLNSQMQAIRAAITTGDNSRYSALLAETDTYMRQHNLVSDEALALVLVHQSQAQANDAATESYLNAADHFGPELPAIPLQRAERAAQDGYRALPAIFSHLSQAETRYFRNPSVRTARLADWLRPLSDLLLAIGLLFALFVFWRYNALWRHDLAEKFIDSRDWPRSAAEFASWAVVLAPLFALLTVPWLALFWLAGLFVYLNWQEKVATMILLAAALLWVPVQGFLYTRLAASQDPQHETNLLLHTGALSLPRAGRLETLAAAPDAEPVTEALSAALVLRRGQYNEAITRYTRLTTAHPDAAAYFNNLGVAYYYRYLGSGAKTSTDLDQARIFWLNGLKVSSRGETSAALNYNLFLHAGSVLNKGDSEAYRTAALQDGSLANHIRAQSVLGKPIPVETFPSLDYTYAQALGRTVMPDGSTPKSPLDFKAYLYNPFSLAVIITALAALLGAVVRRKGPFGPRASFCKKCGDPFCGRCKDKPEYESFCAACVAIFIKQEGVSPQVRMEKNYEVEKYQKNRRIVKSVLAVLFPGFGHLYLGQALMALLLLALGGSLLIVGLALRPGLSDIYLDFPLAPKMIGHLFLAAYLIFYFASTAAKLIKRD